MSHFCRITAFIIINRTNQNHHGRVEKWRWKKFIPRRDLKEQLRNYASHPSARWELPFFTRLFHSHRCQNHSSLKSDSEVLKLKTKLYFSSLSTCLVFTWSIWMVCSFSCRLTLMKLLIKRRWRAFKGVESLRVRNVAFDLNTFRIKVEVKSGRLWVVWTFELTDCEWWLSQPEKWRNVE